MSPRIQRHISTLDLYHVLISGNNNEDIFLDDVDKQTMIDILFDKSKNDSYDFYAYCILYNRANFMIKPKECTLSNSMKKINMAYASYFNKKYMRSGHVFQDRFKSEAINNEDMIIPIINYIHNNPVIEGLCTTAADYPFSSYQYYIERKEDHRIVSDIFEKVHKVMDRKSHDPFSYFEENNYYDTCFANMHEIANAILNQYLQANQITVDMIKLKDYCTYRQDLVLLIRKNTGYSIRKISDLLGINRGEVYRIINHYKEEER